MRRRVILTLIGIVLAAWPLVGQAQQANQMRQIGVLMAIAENDSRGQARVAAFREGLQKLGWVDGRNIQINVFLMDEPLSSLDAKLRVDMRTELKSLHHRLGATFVYVTHDQAEAMTMADRIVVMSKGRIEQVGTPLDIYNRPATRFVAGFFGTPTMNFVEGTVDASGDRRLFRAADLEHPLPHVVPGALSGRDVVLGVRSEHVLVGNGADLAGVAQLSEPLGDTTLVHFDYRKGHRLVAKVGPTATIEPGSALTFRFAAKFCHLFDAHDGARLY